MSRRSHDEDGLVTASCGGEALSPEGEAPSSKSEDGLVTASCGGEALSPEGEAPSSKSEVGSSALSDDDGAKIKNPILIISNSYHIKWRIDIVNTLIYINPMLIEYELQGIHFEWDSHKSDSNNFSKTSY
jgi:hypothetical protein